MKQFFKVAILAIVFGASIGLLTGYAVAENPHHAHDPVLNEPAVYSETIVNETIINNTYIQDEARLDSLGKSLSAVNAISSVPSLSCLKMECTGIGVGFSGYDSNGGAVVIEHKIGVMSYRGGIGHSGGEEVINFGVMGEFR